MRIVFVFTQQTDVVICWNDGTSRKSSRMDDTIASADKTNSNYQFSHSRYLTLYLTFILFFLGKIPMLKFLIIWMNSGSHDSMSYGINSKTKVAPDAEPIVRRIYRVLPCVVRRWAITQNLNALEQLNNGIR